MNDLHEVDILEPPKYLPSGKTQDIVTAIRSGAWLHVTNLWLYRTQPNLQILFQQRDLVSPIFPALLDCSCAGYLEAGEDSVAGAIRELKEELGLTANPKDIINLGRHMNAGLDHRGRERKWIINELAMPWEHELTDVEMNPAEVPAVFWISVDDLLKIETSGKLAISGLDNQKQPVQRTVTAADFVYNIDNYHFRNAERIKLLIQSKKATTNV